MRVVIAGAGNVGTSIAKELSSNGHSVLLIEKESDVIATHQIPQVEYLLADACELESLELAKLDTCDVAIAATGDDKANLVHSLLAKTEFGVPRTVSRVNHPANEWMFNDLWGVDVMVSTPRLIGALVEEAVTVGDLVRLFSFRSGNANLVEMTLPAQSPRIGVKVEDLEFPGDCVLVCILRNAISQAPQPQTILEPNDELLFVCDPSFEPELAQYLMPKTETVCGGEAEANQ
ncbi:MAG: TrkA family potassium uptake protein [Propionibacteriaceae bacterium]|nr:TrkA family potassium uptake protein [Propionibacteriaceae bacterium]